MSATEKKKPMSTAASRRAALPGCAASDAEAHSQAAGARQAAEGGMSLRDEVALLLAGAVLAALLLAVWPT
jgi:hypothetical protein